MWHLRRHALNASIRTSSLFLTGQWIQSIVRVFSTKPRTPVPPCAAPKAASKRKCLGKLPFPDGAIEALQRIKESGHTKCRNSQFGCQERRKKAGLVLNADESAWEWKT